MADDDGELSGVGGWLGFFVVAIAILSPLRVLITARMNLYGDPQVAAAYGDAWPALEKAEWAIVALTLAGCWFIAWRLLKVQVWRTVQITIAGIWLLALGGQAIEMVAVSAIAGIPVSALTEGLLPDLLQPTIFCLIWTFYFLRSKRVANTYGRRTGEDVAEVFG